MRIAHGIFIFAALAFIPALAQAAPPDSGTAGPDGGKPLAGNGMNHPATTAGPDGENPLAGNGMNNPVTIDNSHHPAATCSYANHACTITAQGMSFVVNKVNGVTPSSTADCMQLSACSRHMSTPPTREQQNPGSNAPPKPLEEKEVPKN